MMSPARRIPKSVHSEEQQVLRELLVAARQKARLTQTDVGKTVGKPQSFVAKYEGGERRLDVVEFVHVARAIGVDPIRIIRALLRRIGDTG